MSLNIKVLKFNAHKVPEFKESRKYDWVEYGSFSGELKKMSNLYPDYLLENYNRSSKHNAIINGKTDYIAGNGWENEFEANRYESGDKIARKIALDIEIFGGCAIVVKRNVSGKVVELYHKDFSKVRVGKGKNKKYYYCPDWSVKSPEKEEGFRTYDSYSNKDLVSTTMYYFKEYRPNMDAYPLPGYIGCVPYCEIDYEISNFHLNNIKNGFWGSFLINFLNGMPLDPEKDDMEEMLTEKFTGSDNAGRFIMNFADGPDKAATLESLTPANLDTLFMQLNDQVQQEIFTGHQVTSPMLFGVKTPGQLGGRTEILESYELFKNTYCRPKQSNIEMIFKDITGIENTLNEMPPMMSQNFEVEENMLSVISTLNPIVSSKILDNMTSIEIRKLLKLDEGVEFKANKDTSPDEAIKLFASYGVEKKNYKVLRTQVALGMSQREEDEFRQEFLSNVQSSVLDMLEKSPDMDAKDIAKAVGVTVKDVNNTIRELKKGGQLGDRGVTRKGVDDLIEDPAPTAKLSILYSYEWRKPYGQKDIGSSRDFCKQLLALDRLYERSEIELISAAVGRNVWEMRGGWFTQPGTDNSLPYCRHIWKQNVVSLK